MDTPSAKTLEETIKGKLLEVLNSNANLNDSERVAIQDGSLVASLIQAFSFSLYDLYSYSETGIKLNLWLNRLTFDELKVVGQYVNIYPFNSSRSNGTVNTTGVLGTLIPAGTIFTSPDGSVYISKTSQEVVENILPLSSVSRTGTTAKAKGGNILNLSSGMTVNITGFSDSNLNKTNAVITMTSDYEFTYEVSNTGVTTSTGGFLSFNGAFVDVYSQEYGIDTELPNGTSLSSDLDLNYSAVSFNGITGGSDAETKDEFLIRLQAFYRNNRNNYTTSKIIQTIKDEFNFITHGVVLQDYNQELHIEKIEKDAGLGDKTRKITTYDIHPFEVGSRFQEIKGSSQSVLNINESNAVDRFIDYVYDANSFTVFVNDTGAEDITSPSMYIVPFVKNSKTIVLYKQNSIQKELSIEEINKINAYLVSEVLPSGTNYQILSATTQLLNITISNLTPNNTTLKNAIQNNINDFIQDNSQINVPILKSDIDYIIRNTTDANGNKVKSFTNSMSSQISPTTSLSIIQIEVLFV